MVDKKHGQIMIIITNENEIRRNEVHHIAIAGGVNVHTISIEITYDCLRQEHNIKRYKINK